MNKTCGAIAIAAVGMASVCLAAPPADAPPAAKGAGVTDAAKSEGKTSTKPGEKGARQDAPKYVTQSLRGKVVWLSEAVARKYGVRLDAEAAETMAALETTDGE